MSKLALEHTHGLIGAVRGRKGEWVREEGEKRGVGEGGGEGGVRENGSG